MFFNVLLEVIDGCNELGVIFKKFCFLIKKKFIFWGGGGLLFEWFVSKKKRLKKIYWIINMKKVKFKGFE